MLIVMGCHDEDPGTGAGGAGSSVSPTCEDIGRCTSTGYLNVGRVLERTVDDSVKGHHNNNYSLYNE